MPKKMMLALLAFGFLIFPYLPLDDGGHSEVDAAAHSGLILVDPCGEEDYINKGSSFGLAFSRQSLPVFYAIFVPTAAAPFCMPEAGLPH
jgi:hypothetical protein